MAAFDFRGFLAIFIVGALFVCAFVLIFQPVPAGNAKLLHITIGHLILGFNGVVAYHFGSGKQ